MSHQFIAELTDGDSVDQAFLVRDKQPRVNRNEQLYLQLELDDRSGSLHARYWNATETDVRAFQVGDFIQVRGRIQLFQGNLQLIINHYHRLEPSAVELSQFIAQANLDIDVLERLLREALMRLTDPHLKAIGQAFLIDADLMERLRRAPAGIRNHHAYFGGLLEHIVNMLRVVDRIADLYPTLNGGLLRMGIFLHDLGKVRELSYERQFSYSDEGQLVGHLIIGVEMLTEKLKVAEELLGEKVPANLVWELKHLILSSHGTIEHGAVKVPMTPEAVALYHLDNLDAKVHTYSKLISDDLDETSDWTPYNQHMGCRLYKGARPAEK